MTALCYINHAKSYSGIIFCCIWLSIRKRKSGTHFQTWIDFSFWAAAGESCLNLGHWHSNQTKALQSINSYTLATSINNINKELLLYHFVCYSGTKWKLKHTSTTTSSSQPIRVTTTVPIAILSLAEQRFPQANFSFSYHGVIHWWSHIVARWDQCSQDAHHPE